MNQMFKKLIFSIRLRNIWSRQNAGSKNIRKNISGEQNSSILTPEHKKKFKQWRKKYAEKICAG